VLSTLTDLFAFVRGGRSNTLLVGVSTHFAAKYSRVEKCARPSLARLPRKQAKKLARDAAAGNGEAIARVHAQLPRRALRLSNRDAQLVIAREDGICRLAGI
jgi:hypothetical protein